MKRVIIGGTSGIGEALADRWWKAGDDVVATKSRPHLLPEAAREWNTLVFSVGTLQPIGGFAASDQRWFDSLGVNLIQPLRTLRSALPLAGNDPCVIFFSGAGTNGPARDRSAYSASKIGQIKMVEL